MLQRLRHRASDEGGFTLIELLVVILIIGILAAIAIPTFLNQTQKANDASAKSLVRNAATVASSIAAEDSGSFKTVTKEQINALEKSIPYGEEGSAEQNAIIVAAGGMEGSTEGCTGTGECNGYFVTAEAPTTKNTFTIKNVEGAVTRSCVSGSGNYPSGGCASASAEW